MPKGYKQEIGLGKESEWGTAVEPTLRMLITDNVPEPKNENDIKPILANASFPNPHSNELYKRSHEISLDHLLYYSQASTLIAMGNARTAAGELESYTIQHNESDVIGHRYVGAMCNGQSLSWSNDGDVRLKQDWIAKSRTKLLWTPALSFPTGSPFKGSGVAVSINGVAANSVESGELTWANNVAPGPIGSDYTPGYMEAGLRDAKGVIKAKFISDAWNALARDLTSQALTEFTIILQLTSPAGTVTLTISNCVASSTPVSGGIGTTMMQTINLTNRSAITVA